MICHHLRYPPFKRFQILKARLRSSSRTWINVICSLISRKHVSVGASYSKKIRCRKQPETRWEISEESIAVERFISPATPVAIFINAVGCGARSFICCRWERFRLECMCKVAGDWLTGWLRRLIILISHELSGCLACRLLAWSWS